MVESVEVASPRRARIVPHSDGAAARIIDDVFYGTDQAAVLVDRCLLPLGRVEDRSNVLPTVYIHAAVTGTPQIVSVEHTPTTPVAQ